MFTSNVLVLSHSTQAGGIITYDGYCMHTVTDVKHSETHTAEPLVAETSAFNFEMAIEKTKNYKSRDSDQIIA